LKKVLFIFSISILFLSCSKDLDTTYTIEGYLMQGYDAPYSPAKGQKVELELNSNGTGHCSNKITGSHAYTDDRGYYKISYTGSKCEGYIGLICYTNNGLGIIDIYRGIERNRNIKLDTLYNKFKSYSIIRYKNYKTLLDNDTVWLPTEGLGGENGNKIIYGPFISDIFDTITIYNNLGGSFYFNIGIGYSKMKKLTSCPAGKINSYNIVDVE
jgi:hypothetical protein